MRAIVFDGTAARLESRHPVPKPVPGEAVIRLKRAAVGGLELELLKGLMGFRGVPGREFVGVVESVANAASGGEGASLVGKRVVGSASTLCGKCDMCMAGLSQHCRERTILGMLSRDGCLAELFTLPLRNLVPVPDSVDDDHAVFAGVVAGAVHAARQLTIVNRPYITVLGDGALALVTAQIMSRMNATVRLVGQDPQRMAICEKWKLKHRPLDEVGMRQDQDIVVECTGSANGLSHALRMVRPRGKIVVKSLYSLNGAPPIDLSPLVLQEIELIGSHGGPINEAISMIARGEVDVVSLISRRASLNDAAALCRHVGQPGVVRVLVDP